MDNATGAGWRTRWIPVASMLAGLMLFSGIAESQISLDVDIQPGNEFFTNGVPYTCTVLIDRVDASSAPDSEVTALGLAVTLPADWKLMRNAGDDCAVALVEMQAGAPVSSLSGTTAFVKGAAYTYTDPPANTTCVPLPTTGDVLEITWLPGSAETPAPVAFPVELRLTLAPSGNECSNANAGAEVRYRVGAGGEQTATAATEIVSECVSDPVFNGDANGDGSVDPSDAQLCFEVFLQIPEALSSFVPNGVFDFCGGSDGMDPGDAQGIFNFFLQKANPCE